MSKILFTRGSSLLISGEWQSGAVFAVDTVIAATLRLSDDTTPTVTVTKTGERTFQLYVEASLTAAWATGVGNLTLRRTDPGAAPGGDDLVEVLDAVAVEVR